jgi:hypothetical protein
MVPGHLLDSFRRNGEKRSRAVVEHPEFLAAREDASPEEVEDLLSSIRALDASTTGRIVVDCEF